MKMIKLFSPLEMMPSYKVSLLLFALLVKSYAGAQDSSSGTLTSGQTSQTGNQTSPISTQTSGQTSTTGPQTSGLTTPTGTQTSGQTSTTGTQTNGQTSPTGPQTNGQTSQAATQTATQKTVNVITSVTNMRYEAQQTARSIFLNVYYQTEVINRCEVFAITYGRKIGFIFPKPSICLRYKDDTESGHYSISDHFYYIEFFVKNEQMKYLLITPII